jgi:hypothetical protein
MRNHSRFSLLSRPNKQRIWHVAFRYWCGWFAANLLIRESGNVPVIVGLSGLPPAPTCAPLLTLLRLLTRLPGCSSVLVVGAGPTLVPCLTAGLPAGVTVVDQAGRRWT